MKIGEKIRGIRKSKNMTQKQLADRMNISVSAVSQFENSDNLEFETIKKIAKALDAKLDVEVEEDEESLDIQSLAEIEEKPYTPDIAPKTSEFGEWIPCSVKMPEDVYKNKQRIDVLVTNELGNIKKIQRRFDGYPEKRWHWGRYLDVVAWMPLPQKYIGYNGVSEVKDETYSN